MKISRFPEGPRPGWPHPVAALGNFDGVHLGHQALIERVRQRAGERDGTAVAVVFDPHPPRVLRPDKAPSLLMTLNQKLAALERAGVQGAVIVRFTQEMSRWEPEYLVETVLLDWLQVAEVWVGANFLFGRDRMGTFTLLRALGEDRKFVVEKVEPVFYKEFVVSSTRIRRLVAEGRVDEAAALLGHRYTIEGRVIRGDGRGRGLGVPTANLETENELLPAEGVYATTAVVDGVTHPSVTSVGVRPAIGDGKFTVETHLLDVGDGPDLYGRQMQLTFVARIRGQRNFDDLDALRRQMTADCAEASVILHLPHSHSPFVTHHSPLTE